jgi:uncharacterized membrane protein YiaA
MNGSTDIDKTFTGDGGGLDPQQAAELLKQTEQQVKREFDFFPPWLSLFGAVLVLIAYGGLYMAARGQRHYAGPKGPWLAVVPAVIFASLIVRVSLFDKVSAGLSGSTQRRIRATSAVIVVGIACVYTLDAALDHAGASKAIIYGVFDACGPILFLAGMGAASAAWRENWPVVGSCLGFMLVATGAAFAGPAGSWGVIGIGGFLVLLANAAVKVWLQQR